MNTTKDKIRARITERGWTYQHVILMCEFCKKSRALGAGGSHTRWWLGAVLDGYTRGLHGLENDNYKFVSDVSITREDIKLWSVAARRANSRELIREHGTPKSEFVKIVYEHYVINRLTEALLKSLIANHWHLAIITKEEDLRLNEAKLRSRMLDTPQARWAAAGIVF